MPSSTGMLASTTMTSIFSFRRRSSAWSAEVAWRMCHLSLLQAANKSRWFRGKRHRHPRTKFDFVFVLRSQFRSRFRVPAQPELGAGRPQKQAARPLHAIAASASSAARCTCRSSSCTAAAKMGCAPFSRRRPNASAAACRTSRSKSNNKSARMEKAGCSASRFRHAPRFRLRRHRFGIDSQLFK